MESGIENLASFGEATTPQGTVKNTNEETPREEVVNNEVPTKEPSEEAQKLPEETDTKTENRESDGGETNEKTLEEVVYEKSIEGEKNQKQQELEEEVNKFKIPEIEELPGEESSQEIADEEVKDPNVEEELEKKSVEDEVKEVVEEIDSEKDEEVKKKQREDLLISLREDIIGLRRQAKERDIEIKTLTKRQEELVQENKELKYSGRIKLDDELDHLHFLKEKLTKKPDDKETQKQLALYHAKALNGIYPEYDIQESFNGINERRKAGIMALAGGSEGYGKNKEVEKPKPNFAAHGVAIK